MDFSSFSRIRRRTSSWVKLVHLHTVFSARSPAYSSPSVTASRFSTRPVHEPQLADALQLARTASSVTAPFRMQRSEERRVGKRVSVRVDLGGRRLIKKKKKKKSI